MVVTLFTGGRGPEFVEDPDHLLFLMPVMIVGWSDHPKSNGNLGKDGMYSKCLKYCFRILMHMNCLSWPIGSVGYRQTKLGLNIRVISDYTIVLYSKSGLFSFSC